MTLPLAQAKTGLLALTRREIRNRCPHGIHHHGAERTGDDPSGAQWPEGLAIRPTPRACSHDRDCRPSRQWVTPSFGANRRPGRLERGQARAGNSALYDSLTDITA